MLAESLRQFPRPPTAGSEKVQVDIPKADAPCEPSPNGSEKTDHLDDIDVKDIVIVDDDGWGTDPDNARNWPFAKKWITVFIVSLYTLVSPLASSMLAPGLPEIATKYQITNPTVVALTLSIFLLSYALAPLVFAPLSEMYGRRWVLNIANIFTVIFSLGCAFSPTTGSLIAFRFLSGVSGAAPVAVGGGCIKDLFHERDRAVAMAIYTTGPLLGPTIGPIAGGFIAQSIGVKYIFIILAAACGLVSLLAILFLFETYAPVIQIWKLSKDASDPEKAAKLQLLRTPNGKVWKVIGENLARPIMLLTCSFICFILSLYLAFLYGINYLMFTTFADLFANNYGFGPGLSGLAYLGLGAGFALATVFGAPMANQSYKYLADKNGGRGEPEMRMPMMLFGSVFVPVGLLWYGWSAQAKLHWIMPIIGSGIFGIGMMTCL
ncbi:hypothetical protein APHAL10511_006833 [Amanita phalloides]|nr:hypothetical protein APHAL10511_006833 [Amanita phalloides]